MPCTRRFLTRVGWGVLLIALSGCPSLSPTLFVQPLAVTFGLADTTTTLRIQNTGGGTLTWQIAEDIPWLSMALADSEDKQASVLGGYTTTELVLVRLFLDRSLLPLGGASGQLTITSTGGTQIIEVSALSAATAQLEVSDTEIDFGAAGEQGVFYVGNTGLAALQWQLAIAVDAPWLTATPASGTIQPGAVPTPVTLRANRGTLAAGSYAGLVSITSNGGNAALTARMQVPSFNVQPLELDFGTLADAFTQAATLTNRGFDPLTLAITVVTDDGSPWLSTNAATVILPSGAPVPLAVTADPAGLAPGSYQGRVQLTATPGGFTREIPVSMNITAVAVTPLSLDFGAISQQAQAPIQLQNLGVQPIPWTASVPATAAAWVSLNSSSGVLQGTANVLVTVNPQALDPGVYETTLTFNFGSDQKTIPVRLARPRPARLRVEPGTIDFGASRVEQLVGIWNDGIGTVNWRIDTSAFPAWLSLTPVNAQGIASGTVSGSQTDAMMVRVDRTQAPAGALNFSHSFSVEASGDSDTPVPMLVKASMPLIPVLFVDAPVDQQGVSYVQLAADEEDATFYIRNDGNGVLFWSVDLSQAPAWLAAFTPSQGSLEPNKQQAVTVLVNRKGLTAPGPNETFQIASNDPNQPLKPFRVEVVVPPVIAIGVIPASLSFGLTVTSGAFAVANMGDPDTELNFQITSNKEWLSVFPDRGRSIGTAAVVKDWQEISVSVDRSLLDGSDAAAILTITETVVEGVTPATIDVSAQAAKLTIETSAPRTRIPSLIRYVLLMRNLRYQALPIPETRLGEVGDLFVIEENKNPIELSESNQMLTSIDRAHTNALILLDYSGSMQEAAHMVSDPDVASAPDPLQRLYEKTISPLIDELPDSYKIGLAVFNERGASPRIIRETPDAPIFSSDKDLIQTRLHTLTVVDNGATVLLPSIEIAATYLLLEDGAFIPFDDADVRALICVTDGRLTTPPGNITQTMQYLYDIRVRLFCIGWGSKVYADPLIRLTKASGGHFYSTRNVPTDAVDDEGVPIRIPVVDTLLDWCVTDTPLPMPDPQDPDYDALYAAYAASFCDQSLPKDLKSQVILSYTALNEESTVTVQGRLTFDDPNDQNSPCIPSQGNISGTFTSTQLDFSEITGDPRLGQISLKTDGIQADGSAVIMARADYIPRNVSQLSFEIFLESPDPLAFDVAQVSKPSGGLIPDWTRSGAAPVYTYTSPGEPLRYGDFGDILVMRVQGATQPFRLRFRVLSPIYSAADPNGKYFIHPDSITVDASPFLATSFPNPFLASIPPAVAENPFVVDLGTGANQAVINMYNLGGSHQPTGIWLSADVRVDSDSRFLTIAPESGFAISTMTPFPFTVTVDRSLDPGVYTGSVIFTYYFMGADPEGIEGTVYIRYEVLPPNLAVDPTTLDFGDATMDLLLSISNTGQSILGWTIDTGLLPGWLQLARSAGALGPNRTDSFFVRVNRAGLPAGAYATAFDVVGDNGDIATVNVSMAVP